MLKAIVDEEGASCLRLKNGYLNDSKRTAQLLDTFPMSSVLKKVDNLPTSKYGKSVHLRAVRSHFIVHGKHEFLSSIGIIYCALWTVGILKVLVVLVCCGLFFVFVAFLLRVCLVMRR